MLEPEWLISAVHDQLNRLGCREIELTAAAGCLDVLFHFGGRSIQLPLHVAHRVLFPLLTRSGDHLVWRALLDRARVLE